MRFRPPALPAARRRQGGFTLLEVLLTVGVASLLFSVATYVITQYTIQTRNEMSARYLLEVQRAGEEFARTNIAQMLDGDDPADIDVPGDVRILTIGDLVAGNFMSDFRPDPLGYTARVVLRNASPPAPAPPVIEVITVTNAPAFAPRGRDMNVLRDVASYGRGRIGILGTGLPYNNANFISSTNEWRVPLANLTGYNPVLPAANPRTGLLAAYGRLTSEDIFNNDVLFRIPVAGCPQCNQMTTDLDMNNNQITGISTMTADRITAGSMTLDGSPSPYALQVDDDMVTTGNVIAERVVVYADNNAATNDLSANSVSAGVGNIVAGNVTTGDLNVQSGVPGTPANGMATRTLNVEGTTTTGEMVLNQSATLQNGSITTTKLQFGTAAAPGTPTVRTSGISAGGVIAGTVNSSGAVQINTGNSHLVTNNVRVQGNAGLGSVNFANEAHFVDLKCRNGGGAYVDDCP